MYKVKIEGTAQEIFDKVVRHLRKQGCRSAVERSDCQVQCLYRGPNGTMCAVGCLIPDSEYRPEFEKHTANFVVTSDHGQLLVELQHTHDNYLVSSWEAQFAETACRFGLTVPTP